jgi:UDP-glucose 4-epimerase
MMHKKILVTGGAGFVASNLAARLADNPANEVIIVDNLQTGDIAKLPVSIHDNVRFIKSDVNNFNDISTIFCTFSFDYVFHYAATVGVKRTLANPIMVLNDLNGIKNVLDLSKNTGVKRVFFSSSSEVYGEPVEFPQNEHTTPLNSRLPYAIVKNVGEAYLRAYYQEYGLEYTIFRFFNTYGPKQSTDFVMSKFLQAALNGKDIPIYGDGSQTRTFCYIDDNVDATLSAFDNNHAVNDVANIGSDLEISILELAHKIIEITGSNSKIVFLPALKEGDMTRRCPDISIMKRLLQREMTPIEQGIRNLMADRRSIAVS